jgi:integrase
MKQKGNLFCARCSSTIPASGKCKCGSKHVFLGLSWKGEWRTYKKDVNGEKLTYKTGMYYLLQLRKQIKEGKFNPDRFLHPASNLADKMYEWADEKKAEAELGDKSTGTAKLYRGYIDNHWLPYFASIDISSINEVDTPAIKGLRFYLKHLADKTRRCSYLALKGFFNWMVEMEYMEPAEMPNFPKLPRELKAAKKALNVQQQDAALHYFPTEHIDIFMFMAETGLRPSQVGALLVQDVNLLTGQYISRRGYQMEKLVQTNKQRETDKWVALSTEAWQIAKRNAEGKKLTDFLFTDRKGIPYSPKRQRDIWSRRRKRPDGTYTQSLRDQIGLSDFGLKDLFRHSFCSQIANNTGASSLVTKDLMGHAKVTTTDEYYTPDVLVQRSVLDKRRQDRHLTVVEQNGSE